MSKDDINTQKDILDSQLETILLIETRRLYEKAERIPLEYEEVKKLDLLIEINKKRGPTRRSAPAERLDANKMLEVMRQKMAAKKEVDNVGSGESERSE